MLIQEKFLKTLEAIHPFADGNGRLGRTLMNYYLITHNYLPTIIYSEDKNDYYLALAIFDKTGHVETVVLMSKVRMV